MAVWSVELKRLRLEAGAATIQVRECERLYQGRGSRGENKRMGYFQKSLCRET